MQGVAFGLLAGLAVVTGIGVFRVDSMARATYLLLASFLCVAGTMLLLGLDYLGALTVLSKRDVWTAAMTGLWSAALWLLKLAFRIIDAFTTPDAASARRQ